MDGWNTSFLLGWPIFRCYVSFSEGRYTFFTCWGQSVFFIFDSSFSSLKTCAACFGDNPVPVFQMSFCTRLAVSNFYPKRLSMLGCFVCIQKRRQEVAGRRVSDISEAVDVTPPQSQRSSRCKYGKIFGCFQK